MEGGGLRVLPGLAYVNDLLVVRVRQLIASSPSLEAEYRRFFAMTPAEKMNVPLCRLSVNLMICSLGE